MLPIFVLAGAVIPLLLLPGLLFHYDTAPKAILLAFTAALALLRFCWKPGEIATLWSRKTGRFLILLTAVQLAWFGVATITSSRPWFSLFGSNWRRFGLVELTSLLIVGVAIAGGLSLRPAGIRSALRIIVLAGLLASIYGVLEYFGVDPFQPVAAYQAHAGDSVIVRPPGTMGHADYFGWWLAIEFFCATALARMESSLWKYTANATAACILAAIVLSGTRAALAAVVAGGIGLALMSSFRFRSRHLIALTLTVVLFAAFFYSPAGTLLRARVTWSGDEPLAGARPLLWRDSLRMSLDRPLTGFGPETYLSAFAPYQSESLSRLFPEFHHESPHNLALDALTSMGLPGLLLVFGWAGLAWSASGAALRTALPFGASLAAALIASATAAMFSAASSGPLLLTAIVLGILIAAGPSTKPQRTFPRTLWGGPAAVVAVGLMAFGAILGIYEFRLERFSNQPGEAAYRALIPVSLPGAADDLYASRILQLECRKRANLAAFVGCVQQTLGAAARALRTDDDIANAWFSLAMISAGQNDIIGTHRELLEAVHASPNWFKPHWALAKLLSQTGDKQQALHEATRAAVLNSNHDTEVVETLASLTAH